MRVEKGINRPQPISITVNGVSQQVYPGETLATVLFSAGLQCFNQNRFEQRRAPLCNMGTCFECLVSVKRSDNDRPQRLRACMTDVEEGMVVEAGEGFSITPPLGDRS
ncbi:(2Fe-2S)-binding protein [Aestuariicella hydrocarbonica]|uniref:(2Fe-2S)-binding protein n=1 Tax=Pseudomaricurvus hydrocarbonicus TaxID=1470433 RepID=A0A9E5MQF1_9GAMM|nr:(2Fe-2S)-binding protein [Aestuariicella hydrocarbonica]NHO68556.1 (2Fe-2S)-binding protein [Aestuariicella hydrocarbonica]